MSNQNHNIESDKFKQFDFTKEEWETCLKVLDLLKDDPTNNPDNQNFKSLISKIKKNARKQIRKESYTSKKQTDLAITKSAVISQNALQNQTTFRAGQPLIQSFKKLEIPKNCYACNTSFQKAHFFYNRLCPICATQNYEQRFKEIDLTNRKVILTGGRVKIGYATALKLLQSNADVVVTTRFPALALENFQQESDYENWKNRLFIYGLDLRNLRAVEAFIQYYKSNFDSLDILINNAAQTIKYEDSYYLPIIQKEEKLLSNFKNSTKLLRNETPISAKVKSLNTGNASLENIPTNRFNQPIDNRAKTSWNSTLEDISMFELLEVNLINQISPYFLIKELKPLMEKSEFPNRFIINVTSSEGQFSYTNKSIFHPHTNMTKAALNMMTLTSAIEFAASKIFMNSVDVGWVSTGATEILRKKQFEKGYIPPLDSVDGAARILHPIIDAQKNDPIFGKLLKNYQITDW